MTPQRPSGKTLAAVLMEQAARAPGHPAVRFGSQAIGYAELLERVVAAARGLRAQGIRTGDRVAILFGNEPRWVVMALACSMTGVTCVPLNTWYKSTELTWTLRHCGVSLLVAAGSYLKTDYRSLLLEAVPELVEQAGSDLRLLPLPALRRIVLTGQAPSWAMNWEAFLREGEGTTAAGALSAAAEVDPESTAYVLYTSGSTAEPKGVMLRHRGVVENGFDLGQRRAIDAHDAVWIGTPLFYALGATNAFPAALTAGATLVLQGHFEPGAALDVIERTGATVYYGTGNMSRALLDHPAFSRARIGTLKKGNAGTMAEYKRLTLVEMGIDRAVPAYGLTETYGNATVGRADDPLEVKLRANGEPLPGMEMRIVDPLTGQDLRLGETGLILVRGHTLAGYLDNPEETAKVLRADGFFDTGDLGSFNADGHLVFHSRLKEVLKSNGINISPVEIEQLLASHPDVRDAYVVGVPDRVRGELVVAFVDSTRQLSTTALQDYVRGRAASFKVPHHIFFRHEPDLPRLASGKVAKHQLAAEARRELGLEA